MNMTRKNRRQRVRALVLFVSLLLFPVTINYLSPYIIVNGAAEGIITGSALVFGGLFLSGIVFGRGFCSWVCPAGAAQEICSSMNGKRVTKGNWLKFAIWGVWIAGIIMLFFRVGSIRGVNALFMMESFISTDAPWRYITYYTVLALVLVPSLLVGKRSMCHHFCWMAPFVMGGRLVSVELSLPGFRLVAEPSKCTSCKMCEERCVMSLPVESMVKKGNMKNAECILCGECVDVCMKGAIDLRFTGKMPSGRGE